MANHRKLTLLSLAVGLTLLTWVHQEGPVGPAPTLSSAATPPAAGPPGPGAALPIRSAPTASTSPAASVADRLAATWHMDQLMVRADVELSVLVERHGGAVLREPGASGFGAVQVPAGRSLAEHRRVLRADSDVLELALQGRTVAASAEELLLDASAERDAARAAEQAAFAAVADAQAEVDQANAVVWALQAQPGADPEALADAQDDVADAQAALSEAQALRELATSRRSAAEVAMDGVLLDFQDALGESARLQWHLEATKHPYWIMGQHAWSEPPPRSSSDVWVAVLDSGLAMDSAGRPSAPSLAGLSVVAPLDLVDGDQLPNDEHGHGTHLTGLIAAAGDTYGIAPGVSIMPVRVLDASNSGTELDLIEGIHHAVEAGADIINLSLNLGPDYVPSPAMMEALGHAADSGVFVVGAAGNQAGLQTRWPAASPDVFAVGAAVQTQRGSWAAQSVADYSNRGTGVDLVAPAGDLDLADIGGGVPNGLVAESAAGGSVPSLWAFSGTSQATALVAGAAAMVVDRGASPDQVGAALQRSARYLDWQCQVRGCGAGSLDLGNALSQSLSALTRDMGDVEALAVSVLPWIRDEWWQAVAVVEVAVVDQDGQPVRSAEVFGRATASDGGVHDLRCHVSWEGTCSISVRAGSAAELAALTLVAQVDVVRVDGVNLRPTPLAFATDGLAVLQSAMVADSDLDDAVLGLHWDALTDPVLGRMVPSYVVLNHGSGLSSSPLGVLIGNQALPAGIGLQSHDLDLDGSGLSSSPLGLLPAGLLRVDGTGLSSSPLGVLGLDALEVSMVSSSGYTGAGLGTTLGDLALPNSRTGGSGLSSSPLGLQGEPILLSSGEVIGVVTDDHPIGQSLRDGSWIGGSQVGAATALVAAGLVGDTTTGQSVGDRVPVEVD